MSITTTARAAARADVLFDINMQVREGELVIVTGTWSGKTTLLTILGTMRRPSEGKLRLLGTDIVGLRNRRPRRAAQPHPLPVPEAQSPVLADGAAERHGRRLDHALVGSQMGRAARRHLLSLLGLGDKATAWPDELSGGQQQRVAIARVMIGLPDLIIADEPTSALDRVAGPPVVDQLKDLAMRAKCAVVLSTHDERIFDVASRRLHRGRPLLRRADPLPLSGNCAARGHRSHRLPLLAVSSSSPPISCTWSTGRSNCRRRTAPAGLAGRSCRACWCRSPMPATSRW